MPSGGDDNPEDICQLQATTYTRSRIKAARIFDKLVIIARPYGTQHKPSTLTGRWFVQMVTTLSGLGCTAPVAQETFTNRLRKSSERYDLGHPKKGVPDGTFSEQHERNCGHTINYSS